MYSIILAYGAANMPAIKVESPEKIPSILFLILHFYIKWTSRLQRHAIFQTLNCNGWLIFRPLSIKSLWKVQIEQIFLNTKFHRMYSFSDSVQHSDGQKKIFITLEEKQISSG